MKDTIRDVDNIINELCLNFGRLVQHGVLSVEQGTAITIALAELESNWLEKNYKPEEYAFLMEG